MLTFGQKQGRKDAVSMRREVQNRRIAGMTEPQLDRLMARVVADSVMKRGSVCKDDFVLAGIPAIEISDERVVAAVKRARLIEPTLDASREFMAA